MIEGEMQGQILLKLKRQAQHSILTRWSRPAWYHVTNNPAFTKDAVLKKAEQRCYFQQTTELKVQGVILNI